MAEKSESHMGRFFLMGQCILGDLFVKGQLPAQFLLVFTVQSFPISSHWDQLQWREFHLVKVPTRSSVYLLHWFAKFNQKNPLREWTFSQKPLS